MARVSRIRFEPNPAFEGQLSDLLQKALHNVALKLKERVEQKIATPAIRNFTGQPVTRAEQGLGPGQPPRMITGDLMANVEVESNKLPHGGAEAHVISGRDEDPSIPARLEFELDIPYMGPALQEFEGEFMELLAVELRTMLQQ